MSEKLPWQALSVVLRSGRDSVILFCGSSQISLRMKGQTEKNNNSNHVFDLMCCGITSSYVREVTAFCMFEVT